MTEPQEGAETTAPGTEPALVKALIEATFGGPAPESVQPFLDVDLCASLLHSAKLGFVFTLGDDERPRVRLSGRGEGERLRSLATEQFPAAKAWLESYPAEAILYDLDGTSLRALVFFQDDSGAFVGGTWSSDGQVTTLTPHGSAPAGARFADDVEGGAWLTRHADGEVVGTVWSSDNAWSEKIAPFVASLNPGPRQAATKAVFDEADLNVQPWSLEVDPDGTVHVTMWGILLLTQQVGLPDVFSSGAPSAAAFAAEVAKLVAEKHAAKAEPLVRDTLVPTALALMPSGTTKAAYLADLWQALLDQMAMEAPLDRYLLLQRFAAVLQMPGFADQAYYLAVARYLATHPDAEAPADLPEAYTSLSADDVVDQVRGVREAFDAQAAIVEADPEADLRNFGEHDVNLTAIRDLLARAVSGEFAAAEGRLHKYLESLGRLGYDDDPSLAGLEDIELEPGLNEAAIEEALLDSDD